MKVRATNMGYYAHERRYPGDVFELEPIKRVRTDKTGKTKEIIIQPQQQFSDRWMEKVEDNTPVQRAPKKPKKTNNIPGQEAASPEGI